MKFLLCSHFKNGNLRLFLLRFLWQAETKSKTFFANFYKFQRRRRTFCHFKLAPPREGISWWLRIRLPRWALSPTRRAQYWEFAFLVCQSVHRYLSPRSNPPECIVYYKKLKSWISQILLARGLIRTCSSYYSVWALIGVKNPLQKLKIVKNV